jgi:hypothetical protein
MFCLNMEEEPDWGEDDDSENPEEEFDEDVFEDE